MAKRGRVYPSGDRERDADAAAWRVVIAGLREVREALGVAAPVIEHEDRTVYDEVFGELGAIKAAVPKLDAGALVMRNEHLSGHNLALPREHIVWSCGHYHTTRGAAVECLARQRGAA